MNATAVSRRYDNETTNQAHNTAWLKKKTQTTTPKAKLSFLPPSSDESLPETI
jgi:hypothetical protein